MVPGLGVSGLAKATVFCMEFRSRQRCLIDRGRIDPARLVPGVAGFVASLSCVYRIDPQSRKAFWSSHWTSAGVDFADDGQLALLEVAHVLCRFPKLRVDFDAGAFDYPCFTAYLVAGFVQ